VSDKEQRRSDIWKAKAQEIEKDRDGLIARLDRVRDLARLWQNAASEKTDATLLAGVASDMLLSYLDGTLPPDGWKPCRTTQHCAFNGWCHRCDRTFADLMSRVNVAIQRNDPDSGHWGTLYTAVGRALRPTTVQVNDEMPCGYCGHRADWHDEWEGCVGPVSGEAGSGDCACTRGPVEAAASEPCEGGQCAGTGCSHEKALVQLVIETENLGLYEKCTRHPDAGTIDGRCFMCTQYPSDMKSDK
jgi:hypothetical protein